MKVQEAMGYSQTNKWIMDQIVDIEAVEVCNKIGDMLTEILQMEKAQLQDNLEN